MTSSGSETVEAMLSTARDALAKGVPELAESLCFLLFEQGVQTFEVHAILAEACDQLGLHDGAEKAARKALAITPDSMEMAALLNKPRAPNSATSEPQFLVIKAWGCGFWSDVTHVLGCLLLCELTGRIPVTDWGTNSLFTDGSDQDAYRLFFEPLSSWTVQDLVAEGGSLYPPTWEAWGLASPTPNWGEGRKARSPLYFLNRPEKIVVCDFHAAVAEIASYMPESHPMAGRPAPEIYRYLTAKYLVPRVDIQAEATAFFDAHLAGPGAVALHLRGSDKVSEVKNLHHMNAALLEAASGFDPTWRIFVMSDDQRWIEQAIERYGDRVVTTSHRRTEGVNGVHKLGGDGAALGREVLLDCCIALACDRFAGVAFSNVAAMIEIMKDWEPGAAMLLGRGIFDERHIRLYTAALNTKNKELVGTFFRL